MATIYTIGHSTREFSDLLSVLRAHGIRRLVDIRSFPMSRRLPHFNRDALHQALQEEKIEYLWFQDLGGRRKKQPTLETSPNLGLRSASFRNYADYMLGEQFRQAATRLVELAEERPTAIMCAERVFFRCHRMLVSDYLALHGHEVLHLDDEAPARPHRITSEARLKGSRVVYPALFGAA